MRQTVSEANKFLRQTVKSVEAGGVATLAQAMEHPGTLQEVHVTTLDAADSEIPAAAGFSEGVKLPTRIETKKLVIIGKFPVATQAEYDALSDAMKDKAVILDVTECPIGSEVKAIECNALGVPVDAHMWIMGADGWKGGSSSTLNPDGSTSLPGPLQLKAYPSFSALPGGAAEGLLAAFEAGGHTWEAQKYASGWAAKWGTQDYINCLAFGADPTQASDSTDAINSAIAFAGSLGMRAYLPPGDYKISSPIIIDAAGGGLVGGSCVGDIKARIYLTHTDAPGVWVKAGRVLVSGLTIVDPEFLDEITPKDPLYSGIEICEGLKSGVGVAAQNCSHVQIRDVQIQGFYDSIHIALEADSLEVSHVSLNRFENAGIAFKDDRGYDAWAAIAPTSCARIEFVDMHHYDIVRKCYADGTVARGRYGVVLKAVCESSFRDMILNSAVCGVYCLYSKCDGLVFDTILQEHQTAITDYTYDKASSLAVTTGKTLRVLNANVGYANGWIYYVVTGGTLPSGSNLYIDALNGEITVGGVVLRAVLPYAGFWNDNGLAQMQIQNTRIGRPIWARVHGNSDPTLAPVFSFKRIAAHANVISQILTGRNATYSIEDSTIPTVSIYNAEPADASMSLRSTYLANYPRRTHARSAISTDYAAITAASTSIQASASVAEIYEFTGSTAQTVTLVADGQFTRSDSMCRGLEVVLTSKNPTTVAVSIGAVPAVTLSTGQCARYRFVSYSVGWVRVG